MSVEIFSSVKKGRPDRKMSDIEEKTYNFLSDLNIEFHCIEHSPAETIEACHIIEKHLDAKICKNLFLKNSASTQYYLLLLDGETKFDSKIISHQIGSTRLSFATAEKLYEFLEIEPGSVSIMGLINDADNKVKLLIQDRLLDDEYFCCHPCKNTSTLKFRTTDIINIFIPKSKHNFTIVHI